MSEPSVQPDSQIREAAEASAINVEDLVAQVDRVLSDSLYWFPVRHHSPAVARNLAECIRQRKPKQLFGNDLVGGILQGGGEELVAVHRTAVGWTKRSMPTII